MIYHKEKTMGRVKWHSANRQVTEPEPEPQSSAIRIGNVEIFPTNQPAQKNARVDVVKLTLYFQSPEATAVVLTGEQCRDIAEALYDSPAAIEFLKGLQ